MTEQQTNASGDVAVVHVKGSNLNPAPVQVQAAEGIIYAVLPKNSISLGWIKSEHLAAVLSKRGGCCGGPKSPIFRLASEQEARIHQHGGR